MCDLLVVGATVFDGTGAEPARLDVAVREGDVVAIEADLSHWTASERIDGTGQWLIPGMLDIHTHFDLEVELEPALPEAVRHGTTTVLMSNCSLGMAFGNQRRDGADPIVDCFARVENIPKSVLSKIADRAEWNDSGAYLDHLDCLPLGPNLVAMIPHSMLRIEAMGFRGSIERKPTEAELTRMEQLLEKGLDEGYAGLSTDALPFHFLANRPNTKKRIPTQYADRRELLRLTRVLRERDRLWQATPAKDRTVTALRTFALTSGLFHGKPLRLTAVAALDIATSKTLSFLARALAWFLNLPLVNGKFRLQALAAPFKVWGHGPITPLFEEIEELRRLQEPELEDRAGRLAILEDPAYVRAFRKMWRKGKSGFGLARMRRWLAREDFAISRDLHQMHITRSPVRAWEGESMGAVHDRLIRHQRGESAARDDEEHAALDAFPRIQDDADVFLHLLRAYDTDLVWYETSANRDPAVVEELLFHPKLLPGFSDAGAHLLNMAFYDVNLRALHIAQKGGNTRVARMVQRLTSEPAEFLGLSGVGTIEVGSRADMVLLDPEALAAHDPDASVRSIYRDSFEHEQLVNRPEGVVRATWVNGRLAWDAEKPSAQLGNERLGRVLRV